jgi:hypothetical protein
LLDLEIEDKPLMSWGNNICRSFLLNFSAALGKCGAFLSGELLFPVDWHIFPAWLNCPNSPIQQRTLFLDSR